MISKDEGSLLVLLFNNNIGLQSLSDILFHSSQSINCCNKAQI